MTPERQQLIATYQAAIRAHQETDDRLSALLRAKYGRRAGDMRYRRAETREIAEAMTAKLIASEAQQTAWIALLRADGLASAWDRVRRG